MHKSDELFNSVAHRVRHVVYAVCINLLTALVMCGVSSAAVMPGYVHLAPVTNPVKGPVAVALDRDGSLYVAETNSKRVVVFSQSGRYLAAITGLDSPISVAVDEDGRILVGSKEKGSVEVYAADFTPLFNLGTGDGEFSWPNDICIDSTGRIYVVDRGKDIIKLYDSSGQFIGSLGSPGNDNGQFYRPVSVTIDEAAGEIIVLDRQLVAGTEKQGARVQFFTIAGAYLRGFTRNSDQEGGMVTPQGITVDTGGRIYVTDSYQNAVLVYDNTGTFLGAVYDLDNPLRAPLGVSLDGANRLHVASRMANSIEVYGLDQYTAMNVNPVRLEFAAKEGGANPPSQGFSVNNSGNTLIGWSAAANDSWLVVSPDSVMLAQGQSEAVDVFIDTTGLASGTYTGSITVSAGPGVTEVVQVALTVAPAAVMSVSPSVIAFNTEAGTYPGAMSFTIANSGTAPLYWSVAADQSWIRCDPSAGAVVEFNAAAETVTVTADVQGLAPGTYNGTIMVTGYEAVASPAPIEVTLTLTKPAIPPGNTDPPLPPAPIFGDLTLPLPKEIHGVSLKDVWSSSESDVYMVGKRGTIIHYNGDDWQEVPLSTKRTLHSVWGSSADDVFAVGQRGTIAHYDGNAWTLMPSPTKKNLYSIWGTSSADVYAVGQGGAIYHYDGQAWSRMSTPTRRHLYGVWGSTETGFFAVGFKGTVLRYDGIGWSEMSTPTAKHLHGVWGSSVTGEIHAVGRGGTILSYQSGSGSWENVPSATKEHLYAIWGGPDSDLYAAGHLGTILHYDGSAWTGMITPDNKNLYGIFGNPGFGVYAVGQGVTILYYDFYGF